MSHTLKCIRSQELVSETLCLPSENTSVLQMELNCKHFSKAGTAISSGNLSNIKLNRARCSPVRFKSDTVRWEKKSLKFENPPKKHSVKLKRRVNKPNSNESSKQSESGADKVEAPGKEYLHGEPKYYSSQTGISSWHALRGARGPLSKEEEELLFQDIQDLLYLEKKKEELTQSLGQTPSDRQWADHVGCSVVQLYARFAKARAAKRKMVTSNLPLVASMAKRFHGQGLSHEELCQEGALGLLKSTDKFNTSFKTKFSTYAFYWIYENMSKALKKSRQLIKIGRPIYETASWVLRCKDAFEQFHGRVPSLDELSQATHIKKDRINIVLNMLRPIKSLDAMYDSEGADRSDLFGAKQECLPWQAAMDNELKMELAAVLEVLAPRERQVIRLRYGFDAGVPWTRSQVADYLGLHYQSVMDTEKNGLKKLRIHAKKQGLQQYLSKDIYERT